MKEIRYKVKTMSKEMKEQINKVERFIYLLSSDGHRDSVSLDRGSLITTKTDRVMLL